METAYFFWMPLQLINSRMPYFARAICIVTKVTHKCKEVKKDSICFEVKWKYKVAESGITISPSDS